MKLSKELKEKDFILSVKQLCLFMFFSTFVLADSDEDTSEKSTDEDHQRSALEELTDLHFKFEVKKVSFFFCSYIRQLRDLKGVEPRLRPCFLIIFKVLFRF